MSEHITDSPASDGEVARAGPAGDGNEQRIGVHFWDLCALIVLTALALALRLPFLGGNSLWLDEFNILDFLKAPTLWEAIRSVPPPHGPGLAVVMWPFRALFDTDFGLRLIPALMGALSVPILYWIGKRHFDRTTGFVAGVLLACAPAHVDFSRQLEYYPLYVLCAILAVWAFLGAWERPQATRWILAGVCLAATLFSHIFGVFALGMVSLGLAMEVVFRRERLPRLLGLGLTWCAAAALYLPLVLYRHAHDTVSRVKLGAKVIEGPHEQWFYWLWRHVSNLWTGGLYLRDFLVPPAVLAFACALVLAGVVACARRRRAALLAALFLTLSPVATIGFCMWYGYTPHARYSLAFLPGLALLMGMGTSALCRVGARGGVGGAAAMLGLLAAAATILYWNGMALATYYTAPAYEDFRGVCALLEREADEEDGIFSDLLDYSSKRMFERYAPSLAPPGDRHEHARYLRSGAAFL